MHRFLLFCLLLSACGPCGRPSGRDLAVRACSSCHLFPEPSLLPKKAWPFALDDMALRMGLEPVSERQITRREELHATGLLPDEPLVTPAQFDRIREWYLARAPEEMSLPDRGDRQEAAFFPRPLVFADTLAAATLVHLEPSRGVVWVGDARTSSLVELDVAAATRRTTSFPSPPIALVTSTHGPLVGLLGSLRPTNDRVGSITRPGGDPLLNALPRLTCVAAGDLNGDGVDELVTCGFGDDVGALAWHESTEAGWTTHVLAPRAGFIQAHVIDLDRDGRMDVVALSAQAREGVTVFLNRGDHFEPHVVAEWPPTWGCTDLQLADFDGDGDPDLVVTNGDNDDNPAWPLKPYAGVRVLSQEAGLSFVERAFHPMPGAYRVRVADFDGDGRLDLAAVSQYPREDEAGFDSFVLLRGSAAFAFEPLSVPATASAPWATLDVGDLDGDGDVDLVLGLLAVKGRPPSTMPSVLALENRSPRPAR